MLSTLAQTAAVFLTVLAPVVLCGAEPTAPAPPDQQILILRNGQTIEGRISQKDGAYVIDLSDGQIRLKPADVDLVCSSLQEGYQRKRAAMATSDAHDHLELAQWCLRHGLLGPAATELADAKTAEPNNPMISALEHRLKMALEPPSAATTSKSIPGPSNDELDRMIRGLPRGAIESFTQSVQPVLMNHCATAGCHGPQSETGLRLFRIPTGKSASRRITQRNLYSALSFVDRENPPASRLLTVPSGAHGTAKIAIFNEHQAAQYRRLVEWTNQLAGQSSTADAPVTLNPVFLPAATNRAATPTPPQMLSQEARKAHPLPTVGPGQTPKRGAAHNLAKQPAETIPSVSEQSADPFDAEAFNHRYSAQKPQTAKQPPQ
jgi:hypothetical protein